MWAVGELQLNRAIATPSIEAIDADSSQTVFLFARCVPLARHFIHTFGSIRQIHSSVNNAEVAGNLYLSAADRTTL